MGKKLILYLKKIILAGIFLVSALLLRSEYEKSCLKVSFYKIRTKKKIGEKINSKKRLIFLSDLHNKKFGIDNERLITAIDSLSPDILLIGGDMPVVKKGKKIRYTGSFKGPDIDTTLKLCLSLSEKYPVFYSNGNHELRLKDKKIYGNKYLFLKNALKRAGVHYLEDKQEDCGCFSIAGLDIDMKYYTNKYSMNDIYIEKKIGKCSELKFNILLAHSPMYHAAYADWGADLALSGHFHGGTIKLFKNIGLMTPQYHFFSRNVAGMKDIKGKKMIISAGLGTHSIKIRLNNKPEIVVIDIVQM